MRNNLFPLYLILLLIPQVVLALYKVGPGDVLEIKIFEDPDVSGKFEVTPGGYINFPYVGMVKVNGLSVDRIARELENLLKNKKIYRNPHISVMISEYKSKKVVVLGEVNKPGVYPLKGDVTVLDLISMCGGLTDDAGDRLYIIEQKDTFPENVTSLGRKILSGDGAKNKVKLVNLVELLQRGNLAENHTLKNGDVVFVPEAGKIYIFGEVKKPGVYSYREGMSLLKIVVKAGGFTVKAAPSRTRIIRMEGSKEKVLDVDLKEIMKNEANDVKLKSGDVIIIPESYF